MPAIKIKTLLTVGDVVAAMLELADRLETLDGGNGPSIAQLQRDVHETACEKGWWDTKQDCGQSIALMHAELSEALEYMRQGKDLETGCWAAESDHVPGMSGVAEEMADVVIRVMDFCAGNGIDLQASILAKAAFNKTREHKHGGKLF